MLKVSQKLRLAVLQATCNGTRQYQIARAANIHPTVMSALLHDIRRVQPDDPRVIAIGKIVGIDPPDCFTDDTR
jgi:hypothetical protein